MNYGERRVPQISAFSPSISPSDCFSFELRVFSVSVSGGVLPGPHSQRVSGRSFQPHDAGYRTQSEHG